MMDVRLIELAGRQHGCVARWQLLRLGYDDRAIVRRLSSNRLVPVLDGIYEVPPVRDDPRTRWMAATLTAPGSVLSHASAAAAWQIRPIRAPFQIITRPGSGGPRRLDGVLVCRSKSIETTTFGGIPITTPERTLIDLASHVGDKALARALREAIRLKTTTPSDLLIALARHRGRRGTRKLHDVVSRYAGLPIDRARSDAEALALSHIRAANLPEPILNGQFNGEEADLTWPQHRRIVELDGPQFHLDATEDLRKQRIWESAGWTVHRLPTDDVYLHPERLLERCP
jgi:very-short-patch-repair endonuclease